MRANMTALALVCLGSSFAMASAPALPPLPPIGITTAGYQARTEAECGTVDVRTGLSPQMQRFFSYPRIEGYFADDHHQDDDVGFCFAMGSADLLSFQTGAPVSALNLFLNYESRLSPLDLLWRQGQGVFAPDASPIPDGGFANVALRQSLSKNGYGMCSESAVPSSHRGDMDFDFPDAIRALGQARELARSGDPSFREVIRATKLVRAFTGLSANEATAETQLENIVWQSSHAGKDTSAILKDAADQACRGRKIQPNANPNNVRSYSHHDSDILTAIDRQLDLPHPNMSLIMYDTGFTRHSRTPLVYRRLFGSHVSPVIGRAWNPALHTCEYRVRDSLFGTACGYYNEKNVRCAGDGTFWVNDSVMWDMTTFVTYIEQTPGSEHR